MSEQSTDQVGKPIVRKKAKSETEEQVVAQTQEVAPQVPQSLIAPEEEPAPIIPARRVVDPNQGDVATIQNQPTAQELTAKAVPEAEDVTTDDFAQMFEAAPNSVPQRRRFDVGDQIEGTVAHIDTKYVFVDLGGRGEARAAREQYTSEEGELELQEGETYTFYVLGINREGILLGKHFESRDAGLEAVEKAHEGNLPVQGRVVSKNKGGFEVEVFGTMAFCPLSQIDMNRVEDLDIYLGQTLTFRILEIRQGGRSVVLSRAALQREEAEERRKETMERLQTGAVLTGVVRSLSSYGAFVDLGGIDGLVHVSEISWGTIDKPSDALSVGQEVTVKILSIEHKENKAPRIGLSIKQVAGDPWEQVNEQLHVGMTREGEVVRVAKFGAFVELVPGIEGLVHVSEMSWKHISRPSEVVSVGDRVQIEVLNIDVLRRRISLSMKSVENDPWTDIETRLTMGMSIEGTAEKVEDFGVFVALGDGITALLPRSEMQLGRNEQPHSKFRKGQSVSAKILRVEPDRRRIALTLRDEIEDRDDSSRGDDRNRRQQRPSKRRDRQRDQSGPRSYQDSSNSSGSFGTLGDLINFNKK